MKEIRYDTEFLTEKQEKTANDIIKNVMKSLKLVEKPKCTIWGLNPDEEIAEVQKLLDETDPQADKKKYKELEKRKKRIMDIVDNDVKVLFYFDDEFLGLVYGARESQTRSKSKLWGVIDAGTSTGMTTYSLWTALLKVKIEKPFAFGRVAEKSRHKGGEFCFAPLEFSDNDEKEDGKEKKAKEPVNIEFISFENVLTNIENMTRTRHVYEQFKTMWDIQKSKRQAGIKHIDHLNQNQDLVKTLKKSILHFGEKSVGDTRFNSELDVSIFIIPYRDDYTIIQIHDQNQRVNNKVPPVFTTLLNEIKNLKF